MPNRVLRDWTTSETIDKLTQGGEIFFTRLIMKADDFGNYTANPKLLKAAMYPLKPTSLIEIVAWINECVEVGIIKKYTVDGKDYLNIPAFGQRLRAMKSQYPDPSQSNVGHLSVNGRPETKRNETEYEFEGTKIFGTNTKYYFNVDKKYTTDKATRVNLDGLKEYMEANQSVLNLPAFAEKFMRKHNGAKFNDFMHVFNAYNKFTENGNA